jgi:hypothetical protein
LIFLVPKTIEKTMHNFVLTNFHDKTTAILHWDSTTGELDGDDAWLEILNSPFTLQFSKATVV